MREQALRMRVLTEGWMRQARAGLTTAPVRASRYVATVLCLPCKRSAAEGLKVLMQRT